MKKFALGDVVNSNKGRRGVIRADNIDQFMAAFRRIRSLLAREDVEVSVHMVGPVAVDGEGPLVVREKSHAASPISLEQALYEMELVGHDFYLFVDKESEKPSVVYRRRGYDYGVISLDLS